MTRSTITRTGGRDATEGFIAGDVALAVGMPSSAAPNGWQWTKLTDLARLETGHTPSRRNPEYWDGDIPWVGIRDATANHGRTLPDTTQHVTQRGIDNSSARILPANTVCLSRTASVGYVVVMGREMATSQDFVNWVCDESNLDHRFLKYILLAERGSFSRFSHGTTHQTIYFPEVKAFHVCVPSIREQRTIADVLSSVDDTIDQNRRTAHALENLARATFKAWFVDFEPVRAKAAGATSFPGMPAAVFAALPERLTDSPIGEIPKGWAISTLAQAFEINPARRLPKGQDAPYLEMKNMPTEGHAPDGWGRRPLGSGTKFINGDTLVARITPCLENGKTAFVDFLGDGEVGWGSTEYIVLRPKHPLPETYAYCLARTPHFRDLAVQNMTGTSGRQRVAASALEHFHFAIPDGETAASFGEVSHALFTYIRACKNESAKLAELRDYLLPRLLSGRVRVREAERIVDAAAS